MMMIMMTSTSNSWILFQVMMKLKRKGIMNLQNSVREEYAEDVDRKEVVKNIFRSWLTSHPRVPSNAVDDLIK